MTKTAKKLFGTAFAACVAAVMAFSVAGLTACGGDDDVPATAAEYTIAVTGSDVSNGAVALKTGSTTTLTATVYVDGEADSSLLSDVDWTTSASDVATVSSGTVTAVKAGSATITAAYGTATASVAVTVTDIAYTIAISGDDIENNTISLLAGETSTVSAQIFQDGVATSNTVTWTSSNDSVASVSGGVITALKAGTATITASGNGASASISVVVTAAQEVELSGSGTMSGMAANVYLDINFDDMTAKLYETIYMYMDWTVVSPSSDDIYPGSMVMDGAYMAVGEGKVTEVYTTAGEGEEEESVLSSYAVSFGNDSLSIDFSVTVDETGAYNCSLAPLVALGLLDSATASGSVVTTTDDDGKTATTLELEANTTLGGTETEVYLQLDIDEDGNIGTSASLYEVMIIDRTWGTYGMYTIVAPTENDTYPGTTSGASMDMCMAVGTGSVTANTTTVTDEETGDESTVVTSYTVSFLNGTLSFAVTSAVDEDGNTVYSCSLASLAAIGLIDSPTATSFVPNTAELAGSGTMAGMPASVYLELDFDNMTAKLYETIYMYMDWTVVSPSSDDIYPGSTAMTGAYMAIGEGVIAAATDEETGEVASYTVTFTIAEATDETDAVTLVLAVTPNEDGTYSCSLAPLVTWGLLDAPTASLTIYNNGGEGNEDTAGAAAPLADNDESTGSGTTFDEYIELAAEGTMSGMTADIYLQLDLENNTAKLYEVINLYNYLYYCVMSPSDTDVYDGSSAMEGMYMGTGLGTVTAVYAVDDDGEATEEIAGYTVVFSFSLYSIIPMTLTFNVTVSDATEMDWTTFESTVVGTTYSCPLTDLVTYGLLDAPVATNAVSEDVPVEE